MFHITVAWAALERQTLSERVRAGMDRVQAEGRPIGRPRAQPVEERRRWPEVRDLVVAGTLTRAEGARRLHVRYEAFAAALEALRKDGLPAAGPDEINRGRRSRCPKGNPLGG